MRAKVTIIPPGGEGNVGWAWRSVIWEDSKLIVAKFSYVPRFSRNGAVKVATAHAKRMLQAERRMRQANKGIENITILEEDGAAK